MSLSPSTPENISRLVGRAQAHIEVLAGKIGPRPAGSLAERQAMDYLNGLLLQWGYEVQREPVAFAPSPRLNLPFLIGALFLGVAGWISTSFPFFALALPFLFMILPQWSRQWVQRRKPTLWSENVLAQQRHGISESAPSLLLCAHVDTALAVPLRNKRLLRLYSRTLDILQRFAWMIFALALLQTWGWQVADGLTMAVAALGSIGGLWLAFLQLLPLSNAPVADYSPGANDNASGVGVLLALAEEWAEHPTEERSVAFLFTTAEESGLYGARQFIIDYPQWVNKTEVLCVDMVGNGDTLYYVAKEGVFNPLRTSPELQTRLRQANPAIQPLWHTLRSGDYAAFCQAGFRAIGLESGGKSLTDWSYHSVYDTPEKINPERIAEALRTLMAFLEDAKTTPSDVFPAEDFSSKMVRPPAE